MTRVTVRTHFSPPKESKTGGTLVVENVKGKVMNVSTMESRVIKGTAVP